MPIAPAAAHPRQGLPTRTRGYSMLTYEVSEIMRRHVAYLEELAASGDEMAMRTLGCMALLAQGWNYGDPDPVDGGPDGDGGLPIPDNIIPLRRAA